MKMLLLKGITVSMLMISTTSFAGEDRHKDNDSNSSTPDMMSSGAEISMMDMDKMPEHINKMREIMDKIYNTKDTKERQKLIEQHMQEMHEGMGMMQGMMSGTMSMMGNIDEMNKMQGKNSMPNIKFMMQRQMKMENRMDMMQGMMNQMMQQLRAQQDMGMGMEMN